MISREDIDELIDLIEANREKVKDSKELTDEILVDELMLKLGYNKKRDSGVHRHKTKYLDWVIDVADNRKLGVHVVQLNGYISSLEHTDIVKSLIYLGIRILVLTDGRRVVITELNEKSLTCDKVCELYLSDMLDTEINQLNLISSEQIFQTLLEEEVSIDKCNPLQVLLDVVNNYEEDTVDKILSTINEEEEEFSIDDAVELLRRAKEVIKKFIEETEEIEEKTSELEEIEEELEEKTSELEEKTSELEEIEEETEEIKKEELGNTSGKIEELKERIVELTEREEEITEKVDYFEEEENENFIGDAEEGGDFISDFFDGSEEVAEDLGEDSEESGEVAEDLGEDSEESGEVEEKLEEDLGEKLLAVQLLNADRIIWGENEIELKSIEYIGNETKAFKILGGDNLKEAVNNCINAILCMKYDSEKSVIREFKRVDLSSISTKIKPAVAGDSTITGKITGSMFYVDNVEKISEAVQLVNDFCASMIKGMDKIFIYLKVVDKNSKLKEYYYDEEVLKYEELTEFECGEKDIKNAVVRGDVVNNTFTTLKLIEVIKDIFKGVIAVKTKDLAATIDSYRSVSNLVTDLINGCETIDLSKCINVLGEERKFISDNSEEVGSNYVEIETKHGVYFLAVIDDWQLVFNMIDMYTVCYRNTAIAIKVDIDNEALKFYKEQFKTKEPLFDLAVRALVDYLDN
jgi:hypothetical protein